MPTKDDLSDDYVARILSRDAKAISTKYSVYGLQELLPRRSINSAPKPNTRFLKSIIKDTDSHNAALRAKDARESRARLRDLQGDELRNSVSYERLRTEDDGHRSKKRRVESDGQHGGASSRRERSDRQQDQESRHKLNDRSHSHHEEYTHDSNDRNVQRINRDRHRRSRHHRHRQRSASPGSLDGLLHRSRSRSPHYNRVHKHRHRHHDRTRRTQDSKSSKTRDKDNQIGKPGHPTEESADITREAGGPCKDHPSSPSSDSDPLESIIGPPQPPPEPKIRARGRGALTATSTSAMDSHFTSNYDPANDAHPDPDLELDDWDQALEALRDRQKWQQQGAERLKAAGFSEEEVSKWASGKRGDSGLEKGEEDVRWRGRGEGREWDRGKIVTDDGIETGAEWGRLKGS